MNLEHGLVHLFFGRHLIYFIPIMPKVLLISNVCLYGIQDFFVVLLYVRDDCILVYVVLKGSAIFFLKHHFKLFVAFSGPVCYSMTEM